MKNKKNSVLLITGCSFIIVGIILNILISIFNWFSLSYVLYINIFIIITLGVLCFLFYLNTNKNISKLKRELKLEYEKKSSILNKNNEFIDRIYNMVLEMDNIFSSLKIKPRISKNNEIWIQNKANKDSSEEKKEKIISICSNFDIELIEKHFKSNDIYNNIIEFYYTIPFLKSLLTHTVGETERAAMVLIDKYEYISDEFYKTKNDFKEELINLKKGIKGKTYEAVVDDAKNAINKYNELIEKLVEINKTNGVKLDKIGEWILKINTLLTGINEISEKNKIIAINSSIEAAGLGEKGKGFRILSNEIRNLNQKTDSITTQINNIISGFSEYNRNLIMEWNTETEKIIDNIKNVSEGSKDILTMIINSYQTANRAFEQSALSVEKMDKSVSKILESLQFQDITRQQLESVIKILDNIFNDIDTYKEYFTFFGFNLDNFNNEVYSKVKNNTIENAKHYDKDKIIKEFEELS